MSNRLTSWIYDPLQLTPCCRWKAQPMSRCHKLLSWRPLKTAIDRRMDKARKGQSSNKLPHCGSRGKDVVSHQRALEFYDLLLNYNDLLLSILFHILLSSCHFLSLLLYITSHFEDRRHQVVGAGGCDCVSLRRFLNTQGQTTSSPACTSSTCVHFTQTSACYPSAHTHMPAHYLTFIYIFLYLFFKLWVWMYPKWQAECKHPTAVKKNAQRKRSRHHISVTRSNNKRKHTHWGLGVQTGCRHTAGKKITSVP